ncbi:hypothetical protein QPK87_04965 [Kamptonema cortianum]|nr:hypothetical protein [Geitlerinema splendidum]MDK3155926.1 hypothetical protein [Kamptonema cortianum]
MKNISQNHPLRLLFAEQVHDQVVKHVQSSGLPQVEDYLVDLLLSFIHTERIFAVRDSVGKPISSVYEMLAEADVRLNADSFDRERAVHKHIGDYILFWSGVYPDFLNKLKLQPGWDLACNYMEQGRNSYHLVSTFDHPPYTADSALFKTMSEIYPACSFVLKQVAEHNPFYAA